jgi:uncharacterized protein YutE (UPF0331/DUF86 family)
LDADVIRGRCGEIAQSVTRLRQLGTMDREAFLGNADAQDIACYRLLVAIEAALALCFHVSARRLQTAPEDYAGCFVTLERAGVIGSQLSTRLQRMARFRNLLVHVYWTIDYGRVYDSVHADLNDLEEFSRVVTALLSRDPAAP